MPCRGPDPEFEARSRANKYKEEVDKLTALLCDACYRLDQQKTLMNPELSYWWRNHQAQDKKRREKQENQRQEIMQKKLRKEYLAGVRERLTNQLTDDEKEAIGL